QHVDAFILKIARAEKSAKLSALLLTPDEWSRVKTLVALLGLADAAQQAFSSDEGPSMHSHQSRKAARAEFQPALTAGLNKIADYYDKITDSPTYIFCMVLDPSQKLAYFNTHWSAELQLEVLATVEK
ncbi:hypothetical protein DFH09DRAFT_837742, partial [Mycena vulgaris]